MKRLFFVLSFVATAALGDSFIIERIDVGGDRVKPSIILAETRLLVGHAYTPEQLDQALYRVRRLPFVVDASYVLRPGSAGDRRVMQISIVDQPMFNYNFDVQGVAVAGGYAQSSTGLGLRFFPGSGALDLAAGGQQFTYGGGRGIGHFGDLSAAYTAYGLFGTSAFAGVGVRTNYNSAKRIVSPILLGGIPLTQTQTLRASYDRDGDEYENLSTTSLQWVYETNDDPYYARHGISLAAGPQWQRLHTVAEYNIGRPAVLTRFDYKAKSTGFVVEAAKYWPWAEHSALWARVNGSAFNDDRRENGAHLNGEHRQLGDALIGLAHNFDGWRGGDTFHRLRLELGAGYHQDRDRVGVFTEDRRSGPAVFVGMAYRSRAGVIHLGITAVSH